ncbi:M18 family aminopeptidase [Glaciecola sp. KUL10]|jgi:hypothetical protein|nr:M18 family aminopeptidase [Glaciecola sp. KUL10]
MRLDHALPIVLSMKLELKQLSKLVVTNGYIEIYAILSVATLLCGDSIALI